MMDLSETDILQLESFWKGELGATQQEALEKRLRENPDFYRAAEEWKLIVMEGFLPTLEEQQELSHIKARIEGYAADGVTIITGPEQDKKNRRTISIRQLYIGLAAAAAIILLLLWFGPLYQVIGKKSPSEEFFAHLPRDNANLSGDTKTGQEAYDRREYEKAYNALMDEMAGGGDSLNIIYAGVAAIGSGQAEKAISLLQPLLASDNWQLYQEEIRWYLALAYLDTQQPEEATELLETIVQNNGDYSTQAQVVLDRLLK